MQGIIVVCKPPNKPIYWFNIVFSASRLLCQMKVSEQDLLLSMQNDFYPDSINEWLATYLQPAIKALQTFVTQATEQIAHGAHPKMNATWPGTPEL